MSRALHFAQEQGRLHSSFGQLRRQVSESGEQADIELNVATALWSQAGQPLLSAFLTIANDEYAADINEADFVGDVDSATAEINRWVARRTRDKIQNILPRGSLSVLTRLVLANAIYFKGAWAGPFDEDFTVAQPFHVSPARQTEAPLMHQFDEAGYMENSEFQAVELPYRGRKLAMLILLPRQMDSCSILEDRLTPAVLARALGKMKQQTVEIFLPRFKLEYGFDLKDALARMEMRDAFAPGQADFSGIDGTRRLYIWGVFHKAWGEVNELGTEAAAATIVPGAACAPQKPPPPPPVFRADHPFLFFIRDIRSGTLLFLGRLASP